MNHFKMKKTFIFSVLTLSFLATPLVTRAALETLIFSGMSIFFGLWSMFVFSMMALNILGIAFWIWMIIDVSKREFKKPDDKTLWVLVVVLASWIGAIIYYFTIKSKDKN